MKIPIKFSSDPNYLIGSEQFKDEVELLHGRRVTPRKAGRPKKKG